MKYFIAIICLIVSCTSFASDALDRLNQYLAQIKTMKADFQQQLIAEKKQIAIGRMLLQKPNKFRWEINKPHPQLFISNGKNVWIYQKNLKQVIKKRASAAIAKTPIELLAGSPTKLAQYFDVGYKVIDDRIIFQLIPKQKNTQFTKILLTFRDKKIHTMQLEDQLGQNIHIRFYNIQENINLPNYLFQFQIPRGVDVIQ